MTRSFFSTGGQTPESAGALPPADGAVAPCHLLFAPGVVSGWFYGSDAKRSPLDVYRSPGSPAYEGP